MKKISIIGLVILLISCGKRNSKQTQISENEKQALFTVADLILHGYKYDAPPPGSEEFHKTIFDDGYQLTYNYQTSDSAGAKYILINSSLRIFANETDAKQGYYGILGGSTFKAFTSDKIAQRENSAIRIEGEDSKILEFRTREGQIVVAYALLDQFDNKVYSTYFMTPFIAEVDVWSSILPDKLIKARNLTSQ